MNAIPLILTGVLLNAVAQLLLKEGMTHIGHFSFTLNNVLPIGWQVITNPFIIFGIFTYVISVGAWLLVLSRVEVSFAYPMVSIGYIITAIAAALFLNEPLTFTRTAGILVILAGVYLITRST